MDHGSPTLNQPGKLPGHEKHPLRLGGRVHKSCTIWLEIRQRAKFLYSIFSVGHVLESNAPLNLPHINLEHTFPLNLFLMHKILWSPAGTERNFGCGINPGSAVWVATWCHYCWDGAIAGNLRELIVHLSSIFLNDDHQDAKEMTKLQPK